MTSCVIWLLMCLLSKLKAPKLSLKHIFSTLSMVFSLVPLCTNISVLWGVYRWKYGSHVILFCFCEEELLIICKLELVGWRWWQVVALKRGRQDVHLSVYIASSWWWWQCSLNNAHLVMHRKQITHWKWWLTDGSIYIMYAFLGNDWNVLKSVRKLGLYIGRWQCQ